MRLRATAMCPASLWVSAERLADLPADPLCGPWVAASPIAGLEVVVTATAVARATSRRRTWPTGIRLPALDGNCVLVNLSAWGVSMRNPGVGSASATRPETVNSNSACGYSTTSSGTAKEARHSKPLAPASP